MHYYYYLKYYTVELLKAWYNWKSKVEASVQEGLQKKYSSSVLCLRVNQIVLKSGWKICESTKLASANLISVFY